MSALRKPDYEILAKIRELVAERDKLRTVLARIETVSTGTGYPPLVHPQRDPLSEIGQILHEWRAGVREDALAAPSAEPINFHGGGLRGESAARILQAIEQGIAAEGYPDPDADDPPLTPESRAELDAEFADFKARKERSQNLEAENARLQQRVAELEAENASLRNQLGDNLCFLTDQEDHAAIIQALPQAEVEESCRRYQAQMRAERGVFTGGKTIAQLEQELAEHEASFDLRWKADMRAIARWRDGDPDRQLIMPDHADLCVWLLQERDHTEEMLRIERIANQRGISRELSCQNRIAELTTLLREAGEALGPFKEEVYVSGVALVKQLSDDFGVRPLFTLGQFRKAAAVHARIQAALEEKC